MHVQDDMMTAEWASALLRFWFDEVGEKGWWGHSPALDSLCRNRFLTQWEHMKDRPAGDFLRHAGDALAAIILFDQLPRNMFRNDVRAFSTDVQARAIAKGAIAHGFDIQTGGAGRQFFYMPFMHSEAIEDQDLSIALFAALGDEQSLSFARRHRDMIVRFGRFPHRNAILGRESRPEECAAIDEGGQW